MQEGLNFCQNKINIYQKQQLCSDNRRHSKAGVVLTLLVFTLDNALPPDHFETVTELSIATNSTEQYRTEAKQSLDVTRPIPDARECKKKNYETNTTDIAQWQENNAWKISRVNLFLLHNRAFDFFRTFFVQLLFKCPFRLCVSQMPRNIHEHTTKTITWIFCSRLLNTRCNLKLRQSILTVYTWMSLAGTPVSFPSWYLSGIGCLLKPIHRVKQAFVDNPR